MVTTERVPVTAAPLPDSVFPFSRVAVTGGTGTVGSVFIKALLAQCPQVEHILTAHRTAQSNRTSRLPASERLRALVGNTADPDVARELVSNTDVLIHLAGWLANTALPPDPTDVYVTNALSVALFGMLCRQQQKRFVYTSSHSVYFAGDYSGRIDQDTFVFRADFTDWLDAVKPEYCRIAERLLDGSLPFGSAAAEVARVHTRFAPPMNPKIYDSDEYHIYCLTKLLGEMLALDLGGVVPRLANVYGPGDDSLQAVGEACQRVLKARPGERLAVIRPFKKLVPCFLGDIAKSLIRSSTLRLDTVDTPLFTVASQETYLKEDELLRTVAASLNAIRGEAVAYEIQPLEPDDPPAFTYDLRKCRDVLLQGDSLTSFSDGIEQHLRWLLDRPASGPDLTVRFGR